MATTQSTIQVRVDSKLKEESRKVFAANGLDMSRAIKFYLHSAVRTQSVPVALRTENGYTPEYEQTLLKESAWAKKHGKRYDDLDELFKDLDLKR